MIMCLANCMVCFGFCVWDGDKNNEVSHMSYILYKMYQCLTGYFGVK